LSDTDLTFDAAGEPNGLQVAAEILTFLVADVRGYTRFTLERGDEAAGQLAARFAAIVRDVVESRGGRLLELRGDEALVVFGSARMAIRTAVDLQRRLVEETRNDPGLALPVGMGLDAGEAVAVEGGYRGGALNLASRLCGQAGPGEVLATREVVHLARKVEGIRYADRGPLQLKGVADPVRAVSVRPEDSDPAAELVVLGRSSAPPARRSWWRRKVVATATLAIALLAAVIVPIAVQRDGTAGHPAIGADGVGAIDLRDGSIGAQLSLGARPNQIASGFGALWVTNSDDGMVTRIDLNTRSVVQRITVGTDPTGIAIGAGAVWVANSDSRTVARINPDTNTVVQSIEVGNGPIGVAVGRDVWVANSLDDSVARIDSQSGKVVALVPVGGSPTAIAIGFGSVWVANATDGTVSRIDLSTNQVTEHLRVGNGPRGIAVSKNNVWVANSLDGTVARLDPNTGSVTATVDVGAGPGTMVEAGGALWVADEFAGTITRIDPGTVAARTITTGSAPAGLAAEGGSLWTTTRGAPTTHRGGTLRLVSTPAHGVDTIDPARFGVSLPVLAYVYDGLVGYKRVGGLDGSTVVPDLATSIPTPTENGTAYTFQLRRNLRYSDGTPVLAQDVRHSIERIFRLVRSQDVVASQLLQYVVGAPACGRHPATCDLSKGIVVDNAARTVTFHLSQPDPDFLFELSGPGFWILPSSTPIRDVNTTPAPGTGPYVIARYVPGKRLELDRNKRFTPISAAQPVGYPDRIVWTADVSAEQGIKNVEQGKSDYFFDDAPASTLDEIATQYTQLAHFNPYRGSWAMYLNTRVAPFDDVRVRQALAFALDRNEVAKRYPMRAGVTCQTLAPNFPGYQPYCPYTVDPGPAGAWTGPDLGKARRLVDQSHTRGTPVTIWTWVDFKAPSEYVGSVLRNLGYPTTVRVIGDFLTFYRYVTDSRNRAQLSGYWSQTQDPSAFELAGYFSCDLFIQNDPTGSNPNSSEFCDRSGVDPLIAAAREKQSSDPAAAAALWTKVDRKLVDEAPLIPLVIPQALDLVSPRVGNYQNNPALGILLDQVWLR
jgi:YVTN family beta-propeller protein